MFIRKLAAAFAAVCTKGRNASNETPAEPRTLNNEQSDQTWDLAKRAIDIVTDSVGSTRAPLADGKLSEVYSAGTYREDMDIYCKYKKYDWEDQYNIQIIWATRETSAGVVQFMSQFVSLKEEITRDDRVDPSGLLSSVTCFFNRRPVLIECNMAFKQPENVDVAAMERYIFLEKQRQVLIDAYRPCVGKVLAPKPTI